MNMNAAAMSWFGNICRKFESVCQDVDEVVNHESIKYIERKVQNVGENVMKFYCKVAEFIVSPIIDPDINEEEDDEVISYTKSLMGIEEHLANPTDMPMSSTVEHVAFESAKNQLVHTFGGSSSTTSSSIQPLFEDPTHVASSPITCNEIVPEMWNNMLPNKAFAVYYTTLHNDGTDMIKGYADYLCSSFASIESFGSSDDYNSCEPIGFNKEGDDLSHEVELQESCVIVDYTTTHDYVSNEAPKQPSFKRTIMDALSSNKRLEREYKELAILQGDNASLPACYTYSAFEGLTNHPNK